MPRDRKADKTLYALDNIYAIARRQARRKDNTENSLRAWQDVMRLAEAAGVKPKSPVDR